MLTQFNSRSYYFMGVQNGRAVHLAAVVSLPSLAASAILSLPSPGAVGALPDATVSPSTPMERSTGGRRVGVREGGREVGNEGGRRKGGRRGDHSLLSASYTHFKPRQAGGWVWG